MGRLLLASVKMLYRDRQALFWAMVFPVLFVVVFGLFDFDRAPEADVAVVAEEGAGVPVARAVAGALGEVEGYRVGREDDPGSALTRLEEGDLDAVVRVREGRPVVLEVLYSETNVEVNRALLPVLHRLADRMSLQMAGVTSPPVRVEEVGVATKEVGYYDFLLPGLVAMGVMNFSIIGMAVAVARFREQQILKRILATPLHPARFLAAQVGARLLLALVQAALILATGVLVFGARVYGSVAWVLVLATLANLVFLNIGFAVAGRSANPDAAQGVANAVALPMMFLSGVFFPIEALPGILQPAVRLLPLTPLIEAMRKVMLDGLPITAAGPQLGLLAVWVAVSFLLASRLFRFRTA